MKGVGIHHFVSVFAGSFLLFAALNFSSQSIFSSLDQFVLAAQEKIHLAQNIQVSSGDLASNEEISISENNIINGSLFADDIKIAENTTINGSASFNKLKLAQNSKILGSTTTPISLPIVQLPEIPDFQTGTQNLTVIQNQTINPGNFNEIEVKENIALTLNPGTYNLNELELRNSSKLLFSGPTIINIKEELKINEKVLIAPTTNISPTDLQINFTAEKPITIGEESFISAKILAPNSKVNLGERTTFRGQILAEEIKVGENSVLSLDVASSLQPRTEDLAKTDEGERIAINQIIVQLISDGTFEDANTLANSINGKIVGVVPSINLYQIVIRTTTLAELDSVIRQIRNQQNPKIKNVSKNNIINLIK